MVMHALILAVAITIQSPTRLVDLDFMSAVESWVAATPPEPFLSLIEHLGSDCYTCREIASRKLQAACTGDGARWLFWGRRHRDLEVRVRANAILRRVSRCEICGGSGKSSNGHHSMRIGDDWIWTDACGDCMGTGTLWPWSMWD